MPSCPDCGSPFDDRDACNAAFHALGARAAADIAFAYRRRAVVDAYCLQHPAHIESVKSCAAHLCGLCVAVERAGDPRAQRAIWSELRVPPGAIKPPIPSFRGSLTVARAFHASSLDEFRAAVDAWIADVWSAWRDHHALAREWLAYSIESLGRQRR